MKKFVEEFQKFALRGNVVDLAVAVVIGGAFGTIVSSLVDNIIMPLVGVLIGGVDFSSLTVSVGEANVAYGVFLQSVLDFVIIAFAIFVAVKLANNLRQKQDEAAAKTAEGGSPGSSSEELREDQKPVEPTEDIKLLREIRDALTK